MTKPYERNSISNPVRENPEKKDSGPQPVNMVEEKRRNLVNDKALLIHEYKCIQFKSKKIKTVLDRKLPVRTDDKDYIDYIKCRNDCERILEKLEDIEDQLKNFYKYWEYNDY